MRSFLIKGVSVEARATYNEETDLLAGIEVLKVVPTSTHYEPAILKSFLRWIPTTLPDVEQFVAAPPSGIKITEIAPDLSFQAFWDAFDYKMGNKSRAEAAWGKMNVEDRSTCILSIKKYKLWKKQNPSIGHIYAETFLSQRRWENEYKIS